LPHHTPLIATIVAGLVFAFMMGAIAHRLRVSPIAGYLLAGVVVGPFTPGIVADTGLANELAEIGVILLMFGVGLHFSLRDLLSVKQIAVPRAIVQIAVATVFGLGLALWLWMDARGGPRVRPRAVGGEHSSAVAGDAGAQPH
jgi:CPA2 family monovalent cation:H+ antiporter-2